MEEEFFNFLQSSSNLHTFCYKDKFKMMVNKVKYNDKIDILYSLRSYGNELFDLKAGFEYSGIYDKENNKLFSLDYNIRCDILNWQYDDNRLIDSTKLYCLISNDINDRIKELIDDSKDEIFNLDEAELGEGINDNDVIHEFMSGCTHELLEDQYKEYYSDKPKDILDYLTDKESFIEEEARDFILSNRLEILKGLAISRDKRKVLKEIEDNKNHLYHKIKDILDAIRDRNYVTVNVTINRNEVEQTFKYDVSTLASSYNSNLPSYKIERRSDRGIYEKNFGGWNNFEYEDIVKITYGKNTIYEDKNFKEKLLEEENEIAR